MGEKNKRHSSKRRYLFTDDQRRVLKQTFQDEPYPTQTRLEHLVEQLALPINKISNWFHNARMRTKTNLHSAEAAPSTLVDDDDLSPIVPPSSSWLDSDDSTAAKTTVSLVDHQPPSLSVSASSSSSKKRKSIPQKLITTKRFTTAEHESTLS